MSKNTKTKDQNPKTKDQLTWFLFALVVVAIYFFALDLPFLGPDEPRYSQVAKEMFERGDWVTTTLGGYDWFEKPALLYWLQIVFYNIFGVSEFAARFGSALFGLGTVFALWILGRKVRSSGLGVQSLFADNTPNSELQAQNRFENWLALIAASSIGLIVFSRGASFDIILTFPITAALAGFFIFEQSKEKSGFAFYFSLFAFYFFIGVALIAKGLVGIVFPFAIVAFYYLLSRKFPSKFFIFSLVWGTLLSLAVACVWYLPMYLTNGWKFIDEFFIQHHFQRYSSNKYQHPQPFWFFWVVLPLMTIPWLPFFASALWNFFKGQKLKFKVQANKQLQTSHSELQIFALAWMLVPLVFFSLSGSKLPGYILPALPAAIIFSAAGVYRFIQKSEKRKILVQFLAFLTFLVVALLLKFAVTKVAPHESVKDLVITANQNNFSDTKIINYQTISHSAEFYGAGRLVRTAEGRQRRFDTMQEVAEFVKAENKPVLMLVPLNNLKGVNEREDLSLKILGDNTEHAIVAVAPR